MTEQPRHRRDSGRDYAHVLEWFRETKGVGIAPVDIVLALRDLDAARAERDTAHRIMDAKDDALTNAIVRAEAAEARIAELEVEREKLIANGKRLAADADKFETWWRDQRNQRHAAEARIAAALAWAEQNARLEEIDRVELRGALTGGTDG